MNGFRTELASIQVMSVLGRSVFTSQEALQSRPHLREDQVVVIESSHLITGKPQAWQQSGEAPGDRQQLLQPFSLVPIEGLRRAWS